MIGVLIPSCNLFELPNSRKIVMLHAFVLDLLQPLFIRCGGFPAVEMPTLGLLLKTGWEGSPLNLIYSTYLVCKKEYTEMKYMRRPFSYANCGIDAERSAILTKYLICDVSAPNGYVRRTKTALIGPPNGYTTRVGCIDWLPRLQKAF